MEARPPAENRHGGAPRGERPASWDAPRLTRADPSRLANATTTQVRLSALRPPLVGVDAKGKARTRAQQRAVGTKKRTLFDIVNAATGNGSLRAPRLHTLVSRRAKRDPGPSTISAQRNMVCWPRSVVSPLGPESRCARPGHESGTRAKSRLAHEPLAVAAFTMSNSVRFFVPAARCCARVGLYSFAPDPKRGGRSADRRTISVVAFARRDGSAPGGVRRVP